jgi:ribonuclease P protein component, eubacterial
MDSSSPRVRRQGEARYRLSGPRAFTRVFDQGKRRAGHFVQIIFATAELPDAGRVGFVVSKKSLPRAVNRNRFKRKVRVALRAMRVPLSCYDIVVRVKIKVMRAEIDAAVSEAETLLDKIAAHPRADQAS